MFRKILQLGLARKKISGVIVLSLALSFYFIFRGDSSTKILYVLAKVEKGTIVTSITGSGQVSASNQVDIKSKASGDVLYLAVKNGQVVRAGTLLVQLNTGDAQKTVRDANINLENAQIQLEKLKSSQAINTPKLQDSITTATNNLNQAYQNGFNTVSNVFLDLPDIISGIRSVLYDSAVGSSGQTNTGAYLNLTDQYSQEDLAYMINRSKTDYENIYTEYNKNLSDYTVLNRNSDPGQIETIISETLETTQNMAQTVKDEKNILDAVVKSMGQYQPNRPIPSGITQYQANIASYLGKLNTDTNNLFNANNALVNNNQNLAGLNRDLAAARQTNPLDLISQENQIKQRQAALQDAQEVLANCSIRSPFDGIIAKLNVKKADSVNTGTVIATVITSQKVAEISLNEVDVAKVSIGEKTTLTFDAVPDLTITGQVLEIDTLGTVTQGVVTYNVKIGFDTQNIRIKPGMSVSAAIITEAKQDVLLIPNSAIKSQGGTYYIEIPGDQTAAVQLMANIANANSAGVVLNPAPNRRTIEIGLTNDSVSEVTNGIKEGDLVVTRLVIASARTSASITTKSLFPTPAARGGGPRTVAPIRGD